MARSRSMGSLLLRPIPIPILLLLLLLLLFLTPYGAEAEPRNPHPQELRSLEIPNNHHQLQQAGGRGCSYMVKIKTSCSSSRITRDAISLAFGDAYRNEVYVPRLDDPSSGTFERCSTDTFKIQGPCGYGVCYLYLQRNGWDGWLPEWVKVYELDYGRAITFHYGTRLPNGIWYGFNYCTRVSISDAAENAGADLIAKM